MEVGGLKGGNWEHAAAWEIKLQIANEFKMAAAGRSTKAEMLTILRSKNRTRGLNKSFKAALCLFLNSNSRLL